MPVYDMKCPRCGKQSTEYDENKWQCLNCGNKFVYKEESPTYQSQTNVSIQGSSLFDVEPYDSGNERPIEEPYLNHHSLVDDSVIKEIKVRFDPRERWAAILTTLVFLSVFGGVVIGFGNQSWAITAGAVCFSATAFFSVSLIVVLRTWDKKSYELSSHEAYLKTLKEPVGWIALCPSCKEEHSRYRNEEKDHTSGPVHCTSCGKQFMLLKGKAHVIKM